MARRRNYGFERRQKEAIRRTRQEAKRERKAERAAEGGVGPEMGEAQETGPPPGRWEWFSPSRARVVVTAEGQRPEETPDDWVLLTDTGDADETDAGEADEPRGGS
jgi:hypothetical protein